MDNTQNKKISVSIDPGVKNTIPYSFFLVKTTENELRIDLATTRDTEDSFQINVEESFAISADKMLEFAADVIDALVTYEKIHKNGKGLPSLEEEN